MTAQFRLRRSRTAALGLAILVAAVTFTLLTASAETSHLQVHGTLESNFRAAFDVLVRPPGSAAQRERSRGLVRPNFLSGVFGGITFGQWREIKRLPNVEVAAPIANLGYIFPFVIVGIPLNRYLTADPIQFFRVQGTWIADGGASRYPGSAGYVYFTRRHRVDRGAEFIPGRVVPPNVRDGFNLHRTGVGPFAPVRFLSAYSAKSPESWSFEPANAHGVIGPRQVGTEAAVYFPILVAAIDPSEEARLVGLDNTIVQGRYLRPGERYRVRRVVSAYRAVPAIASTRTYVDERLVLTIDRLRAPTGVSIPDRLASSSAQRFVTALPAQRIGTRALTAQRLYQQLLSKAQFGYRRPTLSTALYWTTSSTTYGRSPDNALRPLSLQNPISAWHTPHFHGPGGDYFSAPPDNADLQFRRLHVRVGDTHFDEKNVYDVPGLELVGRYDPTKLHEFSPLSRVPLETYYPPRLDPVSSEATKILHGRPLRPNQNVANYISQPPLLLTTLQGLAPFLNPDYFQNASPRAPISAIRVRVKGVTGPDDLSQARVRSVAQQIHQRTGLEVDITAGSSPKPLLVRLPEGKFGRPELLLREGWSKKGASISFLRALDRKSLALFGLVLVVCGFFLGNGALASVRARRRELGTLLTLGWSQRTIFAVVLAELALVGLAAGLVGMLLAVAIVELLALDLSLWRTVLVLPIALLLALVAGLLPAWEAARGTPLDAIQPPVAPGRRARHVRRLLGLALVNLRRLPVRTAIGASGLLIGVAALTILIAIQQAFQGVLVDTLLGQAISLQVRDSDVAAAALTVALSGLAVADVLYLNLRDRAPELVTLRTLGWSDRHLASLVAIEGLALGLLGSLSGALLGLTIGAALLGVPLSSLALAGTLAAAGGIAIALIASLLPLSQLARLTPPTVLAEE